MKGLIFAAGLGTRLKPLTDTLPKALVKVGGEPLLGIVARRMVEAGVDDLTINVHHFADMIEDYVEASDGFGVPVHISREEGSPLETGGGLLKARPYLEGKGSFLVHNVDILSNLNLSDFASCSRQEALSTLAVSDRPSSRKLLFDGMMRLVGWINLKTGEVRSPYGKIDPSKYRALAFSGIHLVSPTVFGLMEDYGFKGAFPIMDFYLRAAAEYPIYGHEPQDLRLMDVGKVENLATAAEFLSLCRQL